MCMKAGVVHAQVRFEYGNESYQHLKAAGANIEFKAYPGVPHGVAPQEIEDITAFLTKILPATGA